MLKSFTTRQLIFIALLAAFGFVVNFVLNVAIETSVNIIGIITSILAIVLAGILIMLTLKTIPKFGALTLFFFVYVFLELPTPLGGAPWFLPKIPINLGAAILADIFTNIFRYRTWSIYVFINLITIIGLTAFAMMWNTFGIPGLEEIAKYLPVLIVISLVFTSTGLFIGQKIWERLKNKKMFRSISRD